MLKLIRPQAIITFGPDGISGHPDHIAVHLAVTAAVDQLGDQLGAGVRLFYLAHSAATQQGCGVPVVAQERDAPVAAIDVSDYLVAKVKAVQCHTSQDPPFHGPPAEAAAALACHEYFTLARPSISTVATIDDLFAPLDNLLPEELTPTGKSVTIAI
jgi:LmbE family N-acetylglucosaminyl deacetylase